MKNYSASMYQHDLMQALARNCNISFYGPGFEEFNPKDNIDDVLAKYPQQDCIIIGHSWLNDNPLIKDLQILDLDFKKVLLPKIGIINKEYVNLEKKLIFFKNNDFNNIYTHYRNIKNLNNKLKNNYIHLPFAYNHNLFKPLNKKIDFSFTGTLKNQNKNNLQSNIRLDIMNKLFYNILDIPLKKKNLYKNINIFWNTIPRYKFSSIIQKILKGKIILSKHKYSEVLSSSRIFLASISPADLISPRYFECMGSKTLIFSEKIYDYESILPPGMYVTINDDLSNFDDLLNYYLNNLDKIDLITEKAYYHVTKYHTWDHRAKKILSDITKLF